MEIHNCWAPTRNGVRTQKVEYVSKADYDALYHEMLSRLGDCGADLAVLVAALRDIETTDDIRWAHGRCARALATFRTTTREELEAQSEAEIKTTAQQRD